MKSEKLKENRASPLPPRSASSQKRIQTREQSLKEQEKRENARLRQQKRRRNMHPQKRRRENEKRMQHYYRKKALLSTPVVPETPENRKKSKVRLSTLLNGVFNSLKRVRTKLGLHKLDLVKRLISRDASRHETSKAYYKRINHQLATNPKFVERFLEKNSIDFPGQKGSSKPKKVLTKTMATLFLEFKQENPQSRLSLTTFKRRRPENILLSTSRKFLQCLCERCVNAMLIMKTLNPFLDRKTQQCLFTEKVNCVEELVKKTLCVDVKRNCLERTCNSCGPEPLIASIREKVGTNSDSVKVWKQWEKTERAGKELVIHQDCLSVVIDHLDKELFLLAKHQRTAKWQREQYQYICDNIPPGHCVLTVDFAENYLCKYQNEVQSAHWSYRQVSVHPCIMHFQCPEAQCHNIVKEYLVFLSDDLKHDACFTKFVFQKCLDHIKEKQLSCVHIFSDGCASQYKSAHTFMNLTELQADNRDLNISRHYFGSNHGKSLCDSCGGTVKNAATRAVLSGDFIIQSADEMLDFCKEKLSIHKHDGCCHKLRSFFQVKAEDLQRSENFFQSVKGTHGFHAVKPEATVGSLRAKALSCFCHVCLLGERDVCKNLDFTLDWKKIQIKKRAHSNRPTVRGRPRKMLASKNDKDLRIKNVDVEESQSVNFNDAFFLSADSEIVRDDFCFDLNMSREDFFANLQAMLSSFSVASFSDLHSFAKNVVSQLNHFPLNTFKSWSVHEVGIVDSIASKLKPSSIQHLFPVVTQGDGNCVPRALSLLWFGDQDHHKEVRCRIGLELIINSFDYLCLDAQVLQFLCEHSDRYCSSAEKTFQLETIDIMKDGTYMGMWQLMAASNVFQTQILSIYPALGPPIYKSFCDTILNPRVVAESSKNVLLPLLWSSTHYPKSDESEDCPYWVANHVVPLLPLIPVTEMVFVE